MKGTALPSTFAHASSRATCGAAALVPEIASSEPLRVLAPGNESAFRTLLHEALESSDVPLRVNAPPEVALFTLS